LALTIASVKPQSYYKLQYLPYLLAGSIATIWRLAKIPDGLVNIPTVLVLISGLLMLRQIFLVVLSDIFAMKSWYYAAKHYRFRPANFPDQVVARYIASLINEKRIFVYGNRAWLYTLTNTQSPNKYYYDAGMFMMNFLTGKEFDQVISGLKARPPEVIVEWPNKPCRTNSFYNSLFVEEFEDFVNTHYVLREEFALLDEAWPYSSGSPILIWSLVQTK